MADLPASGTPAPTVAPAVTTTTPTSSEPTTLHPVDQAAADAVAAAGVTAPSQLGSMEPPTVEKLAPRVDLLERQMKYILDMYFREEHIPRE